MSQRIASKLLLKKRCFSTSCRLLEQESAAGGNDGTKISTGKVATAQEPIWKDPFKHAVPSKEPTYTDFREAKVDWSYVERLMPRKVIPEMPKVQGVMPSGWRAPRDPPPALPYYIRREPNHMPGIYLERRRDELNPKTMDFEYVELVILKLIHGDIFACEKDLRNYLEEQLGHPIATNVDELKGQIKVKGADRPLVERFVFEAGF